jgi:hypothetical protein
LINNGGPCTLEEVVEVGQGFGKNEGRGRLPVLSKRTEVFLICQKPLFLRVVL